MFNSDAYEAEFHKTELQYRAISNRRELSVRILKKSLELRIIPEWIVAKRSTTN